jgi:hypothetical protein
VTASKSAGAIDEVMGMLRDLRKKYLKNWVYRHLLFSRPFIVDMALKYPISLNEGLIFMELEKESEKIWCRIC